MKKPGPGFLIAAAFIGPGTVTTATLAGANFGYSLLWAVLFSVFTALILQEMAARLGVVSNQGLAECLNQQLPHRWQKYTITLLIITSVGIGNAAYEAGNLTGAAIGVSNLWDGNLRFWSLFMAGIAALLLATGRYKLIQWVLTGLVIMMSIVFLVTLAISEIDVAAMITGMFVPDINLDNSITIIALIGTTVVPYNLFLHASLSAQYHPEQDTSERLKGLRTDSQLAIGVGGLITLAILSTAAATWFNHQLNPDVNNLAEQLRPLLGDFAPTFFALGLLSAGLSSAITAPLATSYAICGAFGWKTEMTSGKFKLAWLSVIVIGGGLCFLEIKPLSAILLAQASNGLLLPIIAISLLWFANKTSIMRQWRNNRTQNLLGGVVILLVTLLGFYKVWSLY